MTWKVSNFERDITEAKAGTLNKCMPPPTNYGGLILITLLWFPINLSEFKLHFSEISVMNFTKTLSWVMGNCGHLQISLHFLRCLMQICTYKIWVKKEALIKSV